MKGIADWEKPSLNELILFALGGDWGKSLDFEDPEYTEVLCIRGSEFRNWSKDKGKTASKRKIKKSSAEKRTLILNDILVEISGGGPDQPVGRTEIIDNSVLSLSSEAPFVCTNFLRLIRPSSKINAVFLNYFLKSFYSSGEIVKYQAGSNNLRNLKFNDFVKIKIPLPPLSIQRAIITKLESLLSNLDNGIASLEKAAAQLKVYRQAVLKKAFEGELTKDWREQQTDLPTADELLAEIKAERERHHAAKMAEWESNFEEWEKKGKKGKRPSKPAKLKEVSLINKEELEQHSLFTNGCIRFGNYIINFQAGKSFRCDERPPMENEIGVAKVSAVSWGIYNENESKTCNDKSKVNENYFIKKDDFIISRANTIELVGACVIVKNTTRKIMLSDKTLKINFLLGNKYFFLHYLRSLYGRSQIEKRSTGNQDSMRNIGQERLREIIMPLFSKKEQDKIIEEIEARLSVCDKLNETINTSLKQSKALRQSILKKAFEGKLLTEEELAVCKSAPDYEPATVLLERIKAEKAVIELAVKESKKKTKKKPKKRKSKKQLDIFEA